MSHDRPPPGDAPGPLPPPPDDASGRLPPAPGSAGDHPASSGQQGGGPTTGLAEEGLLESAVSVVTDPVATLRRLAGSAPVGWAVVVTVVISALTSLVTAAGFMADPDSLPLPLQGVPSSSLILAAVILGPLLSVAGLAIGAGLMQLVAAMLGGQGTYRGTFTALAFANVPSLIGVPVDLLGVALPTVRLLAGLVGLALTVWVIVLAVIAIRESHALSTGRAVLTLVIPVVVLLVIGVVFVGAFIATLL